MSYKTGHRAELALERVMEGIANNGAEPSLPYIWVDPDTGEYHYRVYAWSGSPGHTIAYLSCCEGNSVEIPYSGREWQQEVTRRKAYKTIRVHARVGE